MCNVMSLHFKFCNEFCNVMIITKVICNVLHYRNFSNVSCHAILLQGLIFHASTCGHHRLLDWNTGNLIWEVNLTFFIFSLTQPFLKIYRILHHREMNSVFYSQLHFFQTHCEVDRDLTIQDAFITSEIAVFTVISRRTRQPTVTIYSVDKF